ncbi:MAG: hybrid sensor histidine kinase/response regulator, partial [Nostocaceae cyanobacterium]|nr:hybrid sensor histidine kinase/response regulator [Nostocaceae cyanobacterium]
MPLRFLLLEDSLLDAELIHANLTAGGIVCELVQVTSRTEFKTALTEKFDLILADYSLPGFDGMAALQISQDLGLDIPFIFVTATLGEELAIETLKSGATDYVLKQRLERLVHSVQRALREAEERRLYQQAQQALQASETQLRAQTVQLQEANQLKDQFLAILSHELRSPLNAILGWSKLLRTRKFDEITFNRALEIIERNATLQTKLIEDLLDISRIIRGKLTLDSLPTNLIPPITGAIDNIRLAAEAKSIDLQFVVLDFEQDDSPLYLNHIYSEQKDLGSKKSNFRVSGDANRLQQIFWNLISNAIKFTPAGGQVDICLEEVASCAQITVRDTGKGIPQ